MAILGMMISDVILCVERSRTAHERTAPKIKSQEPVRVLGNADPDALPDVANIVLAAPEPQTPLATQIEPVERTINP